MISAIVSLEELMRSFSCHIYLGFSELVTKAVWNDHLDAEEVESKVRDSWLFYIGKLLPDWESYHLTASLATLKKIEALCSKPECAWGKLHNLAKELRGRMIDEMASIQFFSLTSDTQSLLLGQSLFGDQVEEHFPNASLDIEEAGKCFALERYTACIYHLMRVSETGLVTIAQRIGYTNAKPGWGDTLSFLDGKINAKREEMDGWLKGHVEFYAGVSAQMHAVNIAWRRNVSHIERSYNEEEARRIWDATKGLMQHLATELRQDEPNG